MNDAVARASERPAGREEHRARESGTVAERFRRPSLTRLGRSEVRLRGRVGLKGAAVRAP